MCVSVCVCECMCAEAFRMATGFLWSLILSLAWLSLCGSFLPLPISLLSSHFLCCVRLAPPVAMSALWAAHRRITRAECPLSLSLFSLPPSFWLSVLPLPLATVWLFAVFLCTSIIVLQFYYITCKLQIAEIFTCGIIVHKVNGRMSSGSLKQQSGFVWCK